MKTVSMQMDNRKGHAYRRLMDQFNAIRIFVRTVEAGSLSRAAETLDMPKSTASKLLADLEAHLGTRLLLRSTRSLSLTAEGDEYYRSVGPLLGRLQDADEALTSRGHEPQGRIRVDVHSSMANMILIPALAEFRSLYPGIQVAIGISDRPVGLIEEGVDCVLRLGRLTDSSLIARKIYDDRLVTCASPDYLRHHAVPHTPDDLRQGHHLIGYFSALTGQSWPLVFDKDGRSVEIDGRSILANESTGQINMILNGLGIGQTFRSAVKDHLASGELIPVLDDWTNRSEPVSILYPPAKRLNGRTRVFIDWLADRLQRVSSEPT